MATIYLSLAGEGRGHATRIRAVAERLRRAHRLRIFAPGDAYGFLAPLYRDTEVGVERIPGLEFRYTAGRRLDYWRTLVGAGAYVGGMPALVTRLERRMREERPDLVITDFEPALPRAARRCGVPFVSLTHQHFLLTYDLRSLPVGLRWHARYMGAVVRAYYSGQKATIVSSFYFPPLRPGCRGVTQVGVLLRPSVLAAAPERGDHLVVYCRRFMGAHVLEALAATGRDVRIYGLGEQPRRGNLVFRAVDEGRFLEDLAGAAALVATAGNQLVGEALFLGKPVLALPEDGNYEQYINAHFLRQGGAGDWARFESLSAGDLERFLASLDGFRSRVDPGRLNGLPATMRALRRFLVSGARSGGVREGVVPAGALAGATA